MKHKRTLRLDYFEAPATDKVNRANEGWFRKNPEEIESEHVLQPLRPDESPSEGFN